MSAVAEKIARYYEDPANLADLTEKQDVFIQALKETGIVLRACERADISRQLAYAWRSTFPDFRLKWDTALEDAIDVAEESLYDMAVSRKNVVATIFYLKNNRHKYRDRVTVDVVGVQREVEEKLSSLQSRLPAASLKDLVYEACGIQRGERSSSTNQAVEVEVPRNDDNDRQ